MQAGLICYCLLFPILIQLKQINKSSFIDTLSSFHRSNDSQRPFRRVLIFVNETCTKCVVRHNGTSSSRHAATFACVVAQRNESVARGEVPTPWRNGILRFIQASCIVKPRCHHFPYFWTKLYSLSSSSQPKGNVYISRLIPWAYAEITEHQTLQFWHPA